MGLNERIADRTAVQNPWYYADKAKRTYITPEDVKAARERGADYVTVCVVVLRAIAQGRVEDVHTTAWAASEER